jgi:ubiquinone/menaquinone biosynthesis C-methylase UbiE
MAIRAAAGAPILVDEVDRPGCFGFSGGRMATHSFADHWLNIDPERLARYEQMFRWNPATERFYDAARIEPGQVIADFGCGPGHAAVEFARRVGPKGHVHALDINAEFVERAKAKAQQNGFADRITVHLLADDRMPFPAAALDRVVARNTIIYVSDPVATFTEFRRVLRPDGLAHAIEGDWRLTAVEPVPTEEWRALIEAASWAWPHPEIGRDLYGIAREAGFTDVSIEVLTSPDSDGRLNGMIQTVAGHAKESGVLAETRIVGILQTITRALAEKTYLAIVPQFVVTAKG